MQLGVLRDPVEDAAPNAVAGGGNASAHSPSYSVAPGIGSGRSAAWRSRRCHTADGNRRCVDYTAHLVHTRHVASALALNFVLAPTVCSNRSLFCLRSNEIHTPAAE